MRAAAGVLLVRMGYTGAVTDPGSQQQQEKAQPHDVLAFE